MYTKCMGPHLAFLLQLNILGISCLNFLSRSLVIFIIKGFQTIVFIIIVSADMSPGLLVEL